MKRLTKQDERLAVLLAHMRFRTPGGYRDVIGREMVPVSSFLEVRLSSVEPPSDIGTPERTNREFTGRETAMNQETTLLRAKPARRWCRLDGIAEDLIRRRLQPTDLTSPSKRIRSTLKQAMVWTANAARVSGLFAE